MAGVDDEFVPGSVAEPAQGGARQRLLQAAVAGALLLLVYLALPGPEPSPPAADPPSAVVAAPLAPDAPPAAAAPDEPSDGSLRPLATLEVGGLVRSLLPGRDRKFLYFLSVADGMVQRVDLAARAQDPAELVVTAGRGYLCFSPNLRCCYAISSPGGRGEYVTAKQQRCVVDVLDLEAMALKASFEVPFDPYEAVADDDDHIFAVTGSGGGQKFVAIDARRKEIVAQVGRVPAREHLQRSPDGRRLYHTCVRSLSTQLASASPEGNEPMTLARSDAAHPLHCGFDVTPDGRCLINRAGTVLALEGSTLDAPKFLTALGEHAASQTSVELGLTFVCTEDRELRVFSYPEFKLKATLTLPYLAYDLFLDPPTQTLWAASVRSPAQAAALRKVQRPAVYATLHDLDLGPLLRQGFSLVAYQLAPILAAASK